MLFLVGVGAFLALSAVEDVKYLSAPRLYPLLAFALSVIYGTLHARYLSLIFVVLAFAWIYRYLPGQILLLLALFPPTWPLVILGAGYREGMIGDADLITIASLSLLSPWAGWSGLIGLIVYWKVLKRKNLWVPAIPGILLGVLPLLLVR